MPQLGPHSQNSPTLAISATFTAEPIQPALSFWLRQTELPYAVKFAPYNQVFQQLLDPASLLAANGSGVNVVLVRFEDWGDDAVHNAERLLDAVRLFTAPLIVVVCPPTPAFEERSALGEATLRRGLAGTAAAHLVSPAEVHSLYPVADVHDPHADQLGHVPYTPLFFAALATMVARKLHAVRSTPFKVIALDCDDTLWRGICGEDGPQGVELDPPRRALHEFMRAQRDAGMLLALCSKNNEEDVLETFRANPGMPLGLADFAARRINWAAKGANLAELADELSLGLDTFILVDDNPKECNEAQSACPGILALPLPADADEIPEFLRHVWAFDHARVTAEDRRRSALYQQQAERTRLARSSPTLEEFLESLRLEVAIAPARPDQWRRLAQLTLRTNQMNLTCIRRSEDDFARLADAEVLAIEVADRFGSYGLTGAVVFREAPLALEVDTFLLSCRVLGRGVEHRALAFLGRIALERGLDRIRLPFVATPRNKPALLFLESVTRRNGDGAFSISAAEAAALRYRPTGAPAAGASPGEARPGGSPLRIDYARIAAGLRDPERILAGVLASAEALRARAGDGAAEAAAAARNATEAALVGLWSELLHLPTVGIHDNFFELGGHSLLAVQMLSRVRAIWDTDLSLEVVYTGRFTVAELARAIELKEIEQSAGGEYQALLAELEGLSDDEVRALLEREGGTP